MRVEYSSDSTLKNLEISAKTPSDLKKVNQNLLHDVLYAASKAGIKQVYFSAIKNDHSKYTRGGVVSRHYIYKALDIGALDGLSLVSEKGKALANRLVKELVSLGYTLNKENGNPRAIIWGTSGHLNHIHVSRLD